MTRIRIKNYLIKNLQYFYVLSLQYHLCEIDPSKQQIWDNYLFWEYEAYTNVVAQKNLADCLVNSMPIMKNTPDIAPLSKKQ